MCRKGNVATGTHTIGGDWRQVNWYNHFGKLLGGT